MDQQNVNLKIGEALVYIYCIYNVHMNGCSDVFYVGQVDARTTPNSLYSRHRRHLRGRKQLCDKMLKTHRYSLHILWVGKSEDVDDIERHYIEKYDCIVPHGLNCTCGGTEGYCRMDEHWCKGKHRSEDVKHKISESLKEYYKEDPDAHNKASIAGKIGGTLPNNYMMRIKNGEVKHPNLGKHLAPSTRRKIGEGNSKHVAVYTVNGDYVNTYKNITSASLDLNLCPSGVSQVLRGKTKQHKGYVFKLL